MNTGMDPAASTNYTGKTWLIFLLGITGAILMCSSSIYVGMDLTCYNDAQRWLEDYPDSEVVSETYSFIRPFGIGETTRILYTEDSRNEVWDWYFRRDQRVNATGERRDDSFGVLRWFVDEAQDGDGTQIVLYSDCSSDMELW